MLWQHRQGLPWYSDSAKISAEGQLALLKPTCRRSEPEAGDWPRLPGLLSGLSHPLFCPMSASYRKESHSEGELGKQPWPSCPPSGVKGSGLQCTPLSRLVFRYLNASLSYLVLLS